MATLLQNSMIQLYKKAAYLNMKFCVCPYIPNIFKLF